MFKFWDSQKNFSFQEKTEKTILRWQFIILKKYTYTYMCVYKFRDCEKKCFSFIFDDYAIQYQLRFLCVWYYIILYRKVHRKWLSGRRRNLFERSATTCACLRVCVCARARGRETAIETITVVNCDIARCKVQTRCCFKALVAV